MAVAEFIGGSGSVEAIVGPLKFFKNGIECGNPDTSSLNTWTLLHLRKDFKMSSHTCVIFIMSMQAWTRWVHERNKLRKL